VPVADERFASVHEDDLGDAGPEDEPRDDKGKWTSGSGGAHWFTRRPDDPYVYHGTTLDRLAGIKKEGLQSFLGSYFGTDPKVAMRYGYRPGIHHSGPGKMPGVLLRALKEHVDPELAKQESSYGPAVRAARMRDFWRGDVAPDKIEARRGGKWQRLVDL
jgi:hypothetical protein